MGQLGQLGALGQMGQIPMRYPMEGIMPGYMPMNMNMNMAMLGLGMNNQIMMQPQPIKPILNLFREQVKTYSQQPPQTPSKNAKEVYPLKRTAYHVAIAYKIYLDKLKK